MKIFKGCSAFLLNETQTLTPRNSSARAIPPKIAASSPSLEATIFQTFGNHQHLSHIVPTGLNYFILYLFYKYSIPNGIIFNISRSFLLLVS